MRHKACNDSGTPVDQKVAERLPRHVGIMCRDFLILPVRITWRNVHSYSKSQCLIGKPGKPSINGPFSIAMLVYQGVSKRHQLLVYCKMFDTVNVEEDGMTSSTKITTSK